MKNVALYSVYQTCKEVLSVRDKDKKNANLGKKINRGQHLSIVVYI